MLFQSIFSQTQTLDSTFASNGYTQGVTNPGVANAMVVQPDGKIVLSLSRKEMYANLNDPDENRFHCIRHLPDGSLDSSFGNGGIAEINVIGSAEPLAIALQNDGKIISAGLFKILRQYCLRI